MRTLSKTRITLTVAVVVVAFMLAASASIMSAPIHAESSIRVTQSTGDGTSSLRVTQSDGEGLKVKCEGDLNCEIIGDDTVVATSEDNNTASSAAVATILNQSNTIQSSSDFDIIDDEKDLGAMIEGTVDRLLDDISAELINSLSLFRAAY
ncbi:MAG TPA: hypothetical protein VHF65_06535 [Nitrososphaera sp.]|nr:hypothetical protein [Nitrososphaera sp.]